VGVFLAAAQEPRPFLHARGAPGFAPFRATGAASGELTELFAVGASHTLIKTWDAARSRSRLWALGSNEYGQLGVPQHAGTSAPTHVPRPIPAFDEAAGGRQSQRYRWMGAGSPNVCVRRR